MVARTQLDAVYEWERKQPDKVWFTQPMGPGRVRDITWKQALDEARRMAAHLVSLDLPRPSQICIFSKNTAWWILADLAIWMAGHVSVPLYATLAPETIRQILEHSEAKLILIGKLDGFEAMAPGIPAGLPRILLPLSPAIDGPKWDDIIAKTEPLEKPVERKPDELATIIYTSGSTGVPKGVMHTFEAMTKSGAGFVKRLGLNPAERMLSYLPLAHSFERTVLEQTTFLAGFQVYFAESTETFVADIKRAQPTLFISVPRLWQKFQLGVHQKMPPKKLKLFLKIPILGSIVRKKVLDGLGFGQVRFAGSGSAPIPADLIAWYRSLGLELLEGYGLTENSSYSHMCRPGEVRVGYVGQPHDDCQQRISDEGEVLVKSPGTMTGYFKAPELTAQVMTEDGYLKTGDRGQVDERGRLKITGRVKELFKTSKGKYVAPAPIENRLLLHPDVEQACVTGPNQPQPFGMVVLSEAARKRVKDAAERERIGQSLEAHVEAINAELDPHEQLELVVVISDEWTVENGLLTPTMKLKRAAIEDRYTPSVDGWYGARRKVLWA